ncbi:MAG: Tn7 transposase TnsA N-terminal domain-containing protein [Fimbriiglobus sp.]
MFSLPFDPDPKYFRLWHHVVGGLSAGEKYGTGKPKPEPLYRDAQGALVTLAGQWRERSHHYRDANPDQEQIPPVMILVCDNTEIADYFYRQISGESESDAVTDQDVDDVQGGDDEEDELASKKGKAKTKTAYGTSAIPDRGEWEIKFPLVNGYAFGSGGRGLLTCDVDAIEPVNVSPKTEPTGAFLKPLAGIQDQEAPGVSRSGYELQTREQYHANTHYQTILFEIARRIVDDIVSPTETNPSKKSRVMRLYARHHLFPQVLQFVTEYAARRVTLNGQDPREIGLQTYADRIIERVRESIFPDTKQGEPPLLPILDRNRPMGTTEKVDFTTTRPVVPTTRSHINFVVLDSGWEKAAAAALDACPLVDCFARNDHLGLVIPYEHLGQDHEYSPDFLVRLKSGRRALVEVKGYEVHNPDRNAAKFTAAKRWVTAVNNLNDEDFGQWGLAVVRQPDMSDILPQFEALTGG